MMKNGSKNKETKVNMKRNLNNDKPKKAVLSRKDNLQLLETYELTESSAKNLLIANVKKLYEEGKIVRLDAAENLIKLVQDGKLYEFEKNQK